MDELDNQRKDQVYKPYLAKNPSSPIAIYVLNRYGGYDIDADKVEPIFTKLSDAVKNSDAGVAYKKRLDIAKRVGIGKIAPDFTQADTLGNPVSLASFRGKYVLVDFWASWCGPCRRTMPGLKSLYAKYKSKGFEIYAISVDQDPAAWKQAVAQDATTWTHVLDSQGNVATQWNVRYIPNSYLMDKEGKVVAVNLSEEDLEKQLAKLTK